MEEYKGIYYGDEEEEHYYEGGAHFKHSKLYKILEKLSKERNIKEQKDKEIPSYIIASNEKNNKKTRNVNNFFSISKISYNTIGNKINKKNEKINNKIFISVNKINEKNDIKNNYLLLKYKKKQEMNTRNKNDSINSYKCRPNTILKDDKLKKCTSIKKDRLSSSVELKNKNKKKINLKHSLPEFNATKIKNDHNFSTHRKKKNQLVLGLNDATTKTDKKKDKTYNAKKYNTLNKNEIQKNISYSHIKNKNKTYLKREKLYEQMNNTENKPINKKQNFLHTNSMKISDKTHVIINKRITVNKNSNINTKSKALNSSDILRKIKNDKDNIDMIINRAANKKKNIKKDFNAHNNTYLERTTNKDSKIKNRIKTPKRENNSNEKKVKNFVLFNKNNIMNKKSRNDKEKSLSKNKNTYNHYYNSNNKSKINFINDKCYDNNRTMFDKKKDINKTYNYFKIDKNFLNKKNNIKSNDDYINKKKHTYK